MFKYDIFEAHMGMVAKLAQLEAPNSWNSVNLDISSISQEVILTTISGAVQGH